MEGELSIGSMIWFYELDYVVNPQLPSIVLFGSWGLVSIAVQSLGTIQKFTVRK